jgi:hypothetical protein
MASQSRAEMTANLQGRSPDQRSDNLRGCELLLWWALISFLCAGFWWAVWKLLSCLT